MVKLKTTPIHLLFVIAGLIAFFKFTWKALIAIGVAYVLWVFRKRLWSLIQKAIEKVRGGNQEATPVEPSPLPKKEETQP